MATRTSPVPVQGVAIVCSPTGLGDSSSVLYPAMSDGLLGAG